MATAACKIKCLKEAAEKSPEYAGITELFIEQFRYLEVHGRYTGITFNISRDNRPDNVKDGFPLLPPDCVQVENAAFTSFILGLLVVLKRVGQAGGNELDRISEALTTGQLDPVALFRAILERDRKPLDEASQSINVPPPLLEYVFEIPLKAALELVASGISPDELVEWKEGYCPVCGSRPGMAELAGEEGKRFLCCSACSFRWPFKRIQCPFCGCEDTEKLSYFTVGDAPCRVDTCTACSRYIKTRDSRKGNSDVPLEVDDLLTIHLDLLASREGFERGK